MTPTEARALIAGLTHSEKLQLLALLLAMKMPPVASREHKDRPHEPEGR